MLARRKRGGSGGPAGPGGRLTSFREGLQELIDALVAAVGPRLKRNSAVTGLTHMQSRGFRVHMSEGAPFDVDAVVLACPAWRAARVVESMDTEMFEALNEIPSAPLSVVHLGYRRDALGTVPEGFGFLVPRGQGPRILGALWPTCMFDGRAPRGGLLMTVMLGGALDPEGVGLEDRELLRIVRRDLQMTLGVHANPYFTRIVRHPRGIPQYTMGHRRRLDTIERRQATMPGLWITGNSLRGVAINSCVAEATEVADAALNFLSGRAGAGR